LDFPPSFSKVKPALDDEYVLKKPVENIQTLADQLLLQQFSPSGVLVNDTVTSSISVPGRESIWNRLSARLTGTFLPCSVTGFGPIFLPPSKGLCIKNNSHSF